MRVEINGWAWLDKADITPVQLFRLKESLTITPRRTHPDADEPTPIELFENRANHFGVPRAFFLEKQTRSNVVRWKVNTGTPWPDDIEFKGTPRPGQQRALDAVIPQLMHEGEVRLGAGGVVKAPTGWGKTVFGCACMAKVRLPTLIVVHNEMLFDQWTKRIKTGETTPDGFLPPFLPDVKLGFVQGKKCEFEGCQIVIGMMQTLASKKFEPPPGFFEYFGFLVCDEVHIVGAPTWSQVPPKFPTALRLGLSATPRRKDRAENVFWYHLGSLLYSADQETTNFTVRRVWTKFDPSYGRQVPAHVLKEATLLRQMTRSIPRNMLIADLLVKAVAAGRRVLALSKRLKHLEIMIETFRSEWWVAHPDESEPFIGHCVGGISAEQLAEIKAKAQIIFATVQYVSVGFDVPSLDTLFLMMPIADVEQALGRILRQHEGKKLPMVVDIRDDKVVMFERFARCRDNMYARLGAKVLTFGRRS